MDPMYRVDLYRRDMSKGVERPMRIMKTEGERERMLNCARRKTNRTVIGNIKANFF